MTKENEADGSVFVGQTASSDAAGLFIDPHGMIIDSKQQFAYLTEKWGHRLRRIDLHTRNVVTIAGRGAAGRKDGVGTNAEFCYPRGLCFADEQQTRVLICDWSSNTIRSVCIAPPPAASSSTTSTSTNKPSVVDNDLAVFGRVTTFAGSDKGAGCVDGNRLTDARFRRPFAIVHDPIHDCYFVSDQFTNCIRKIASADGAVTVWAGNQKGSETNYADGIGTNTLFNAPTGLAIDVSTNRLFVADRNNAVIRCVSTVTAAVTTFAGQSSDVRDPPNGDEADPLDGDLNSAVFFPVMEHLTFDRISNTLFVAHYRWIRAISDHRPSHGTLTSALRPWLLPPLIMIVIGYFGAQYVSTINIPHRSTSSLEEHARRPTVYSVVPFGTSSLLVACNDHLVRCISRPDDI